MKKFIQEHYKNVLFCLIGSFINALGVNLFIIGANMGDGGTIGIALALKYTLGFSPAISSLIINTLVIIIGLEIFK